MNDIAENRPVAIVTGSSSGIGAATALRLAADGFHVGLHANRNRPGAGEVMEHLGRVAGCQARLFCCDFSDPEQLDPFVEECFAWQGGVQVWINNAGADVLTGEMADAPFLARLERVLQVDVIATLVLSRLVAGRMRETGRPAAAETVADLIVNIGWDQAATGMAGDGGQMFAASKGAIMSATRSLARSYAPDVRFNCVAPGWIRTAWGEQASAAWQERAVEESLLGRWGQPADVAGVISFLAGPDGQFVNGQVIPVNGGFRYGSRSNS